MLFNVVGIPKLNKDSSWVIQFQNFQMVKVVEASEKLP